LGRQMVRTLWGSRCKAAGVEINDWQEGSGSGCWYLPPVKGTKVSAVEVGSVDTWEQEVGMPE
jgi:hypothetical protein